MSNSEGRTNHWEEELEEIEALAREAKEAWKDGEKQDTRRALAELSGRITTVREDASFQ